MGDNDLGGAGGVEFWRAEAERLAADNVVLKARVGDLEGQVDALAERVSVLARLAFGASSEKAAKRAAGGDGPGGSSGEDSAGDDTAGGQPKRDRGQQRGSAGACHYNRVSHGWTKIDRRDHHSVGRGPSCAFRRNC